MWKTKPSKLVAIVVPLSNRKELTPDEEISLRHLRHFLGAYDKYMLLPQSLDVQYDDFKLKRFDDSFFGSGRAYGRLMVSPHFYKAFRDYRFILIYHLDALVFSDQLKEWCARDFDCIAPPWIKYEGAPYGGLPIENKNGNGGFSLRKVSSFLNVLRAVRRPAFTKEYARRILRRAKPIEHRRNEDIFWALYAKNYCPEFRLAPLETALQFAFECNPRLCFEQNRQQMPFGCHAWSVYDRAFWDPHLLCPADEGDCATNSARPV